MKYWYIDYPEEIKPLRVDSKIKEFKEERNKIISEIMGLNHKDKE